MHRRARESIGSIFTNGGGRGYTLREHNEMTTNVAEARFTEVSANISEPENNVGLLLALGCLLDELPGAVLGVITVWYLASSLLALI